MQSQTIYHIALVGHIVGLTIMAGTTLVDYIMTKQFWKQFATSRSKALPVLEAMSNLPRLIAIGIILLVASGITMMALTGGIFGEQIWFRIKFGLVLAIIINGLAIGRRLGRKLRRALSDETTGPNALGNLLKLRKNIRWFHLVQITFFVIIYVLSVFKFN